MILPSASFLLSDICAQVKNYPEVEQFTSYKSVYTVPVRSIDEDLDSCVRSCTIALIGLASNTQIFNQSYSPLNLHDLRKDDVAIFVGALLLKFCTIITSGCYASKLADPEDLDDYPKEPEYEKCPCGADEDPKTVSIVVTSLMTIIGCFPNVGHCVVEGNKLILFALRPIKEGEKLCSYTESSIYECTPKSERQSQHRLFYNSSCDCIACTQNWSATLQDNKKLTEICVAEIRNSLIGAQIKREIDAISKQLEACSLSLNHPDFDLLEKAKNLVFKAWTHFHMPSPLIIASTKTMKSLITNLFALPKVPRGLSGPCS
ncbi:hypothetical protein QAD02_001218 [Eretmocerus hayati]|uniref:Uncharacterized protein n=1 Tax=Eretmocerus hayati TaxID=131215 RepID=A0ACC2NFU9_9HYME|nr:hypothetical protein QAD02_001218 [Eretmocerus hayati]